MNDCNIHVKANEFFIGANLQYSAILSKNKEL